MSRQILLPITVWPNERGEPVRWQWREKIYSGRVVHTWNLSAYWWEPDRHSNRFYYRMETRDHQVFDLYCDAAKDGIWILSHIQD